MADIEDPNLTEDEHAALVALKIVTGLIARRYRVCPLCLTFNMATVVQEAEDRGFIHHWGADGDPEEKDPDERTAQDVLAEDLHRLLLKFEAGTKH